MCHLKSVCLSVLLLMSLMFACGSGAESDAYSPDPGKLPEVTPPGARVQLESKSGSTVEGLALFSGNPGADGGEAAMEVTLVLELSAAPAGEHAVHIHETGDCSSADGKSAGGHWNPVGVDHGQWGEGVHHLGDIGNLLIGEDGTGALTLTTDRWTIGDGGAADVVGHAIIVHSGVDDFVTQPTGAAGGRIACGLIVQSSDE